MSLSHLAYLESESIHILREAVAESENPVMLYSIGKDSSVLLHLALKAFYPAPLPFPLLHIDTTWKFRQMIQFRDETAKKYGLQLLVYTNQAGLTAGANPFVDDATTYTDLMKTQALKQALDHYQFDVAFAGARRDEEKSRAKERIISLRTASHRWDPKRQRPELWHLYNLRKSASERLRVFPLSNWTEFDIWQYIYQERIDLVPLYFAAMRPVVTQQDRLVMVDDERMPQTQRQHVTMRCVRFRTLGCYPLTGAMLSEADSIPKIIDEIFYSRISERQGRLIDYDSAASMEKKKQEGYF